MWGEGFLASYSPETNSCELVLQKVAITTQFYLFTFRINLTFSMFILLFSSKVSLRIEISVCLSICLILFSVKIPLIYNHLYTRDVIGLLVRLQKTKLKRIFYWKVSWLFFHSWFFVLFAIFLLSCLKITQLSVFQIYSYNLELLMLLSLYLF